MLNFVVQAPMGCESVWSMGAHNTVTHINNQLGDYTKDLAFPVSLCEREHLLSMILVFESSHFFSQYNLRNS